MLGPRYTTYVVAKRDFALFSLGRLPDNAKSRLRAERIAGQLHAHRWASEGSSQLDDSIPSTRAFSDSSADLGMLRTPLALVQPNTDRDASRRLLPVQGVASVGTSDLALGRQPPS